MTKVVAVVVGLLLLLSWAGVRIVNDIQFSRQCTGHIKRAADSNTVELAEEELKVALDYAERNGMTSGYTSVMYQSPDEDVKFWYTNLHDAYHQLLALPETATPLEKSNLLMKLRQTLLDHGKDGESVTYPSGLSVFPNNGFYAWWGWLGLILLAIGIGGALLE
jgi:hypothetical protein